MLWTRETVIDLATRRERESEFESKRRQRMDEREARARLHRPTGNVIPLGSRARVYKWPPDEAA